MAKLLGDVRVGDWYRSFGGGPPFEIVAIDLDQECIEIQYFDGAVEEIEFDSWLEMELQSVAPPEDFSGALDLDRDDYRGSMDMGGGSGREFRGNPLDELDRLDAGGVFE